ncbi:hypothetical protein Hanom_Chr11g01058221 [Helianthus anomalus]
MHSMLYILYIHTIFSETGMTKIVRCTFNGSGLPSATGTLGYPAISHYPFAHENG